MGVDAEMFIRIRGKDRLTESQVRRLSYEIGTAFDTDFFFTMNPLQGLFNEERRALEIMQPIPAEEVEDYGLEPQHAGKVVWAQDGDPIVAEDDEQFIRVNLYGSYYGPGYERGDWPKLRACIFWLSARIPQGRVWYGGDSGGCCVEPADATFLAKLDMHWALHARRPYVRYKSDLSAIFGKKPTDSIVPPICNLCTEPMAGCGGSSSYSFFWCDGCGLKASKHISGQTEFAGRHEDYPSINEDGTVVRRKNGAA